MRLLTLTLKLLSISIFALILIGSGTTKKSVIKIGAYMPNTGDFATYGEGTTRAIKLAVDEINAKGGILGRKVKLIVEDTRCTKEGARFAVQKLIHKDKVDVVVGEVASSDTIAGAEVCQRAKIPMVTPSSTNPRVTKIGDFIFRVCFTDDFQGMAIASFAVKHLKAKRAAIFYDKAQDYSIGLKDGFKKTFNKLGGKIVGEYAYFTGDKDFKGQLTKIKALKPQVIMVPGYYKEVALIARQARELGIKEPLIGGDGWDSPRLVEVAGEAVENCYFTNHYSVEMKTPVVQRFVKAYKARYKTLPDALAACGYDAIYVVKNAIERAKKIDPVAIKNALAKTKNFVGVTGTITINSLRNAEKPAVVLKIKNGKQVLVTTIKPQ